MNNKVLISLDLIVKKQSTTYFENQASGLWVTRRTAFLGENHSRI
jgi:hypothetical protein